MTKRSHTVSRTYSTATIADSTTEIGDVIDLSDRYGKVCIFGNVGIGVDVSVLYGASKTGTFYLSSHEHLPLNSSGNLSSDIQTSAQFIKLQFNNQSGGSKTIAVYVSLKEH